MASFGEPEDDEQVVKLQDIVDLFVAAGYFRARIKSVSHFDRIVGGIVWCITSCNRTVDVDLFYSESATIGQKIALTEKVVDVLRQLNCPHNIEPYQIQGLDCTHIFHVVQWLVKESVRAKEKYGDSLRNYAVYQFAQRFRFSKEKCTEKQTAVFLNNCLSVKSKCSLQRIYKQKGDLKPPDLLTDVRCTLLEYGWKDGYDVAVQENAEWFRNDKDDENTKADHFLMKLPKAQSQSKNLRVSSGALAQMIDVLDCNTDGLMDKAGFGEQYQQSTSIPQQELMKFREEERILDDSLENLRQRKEAQLREMDEIDGRILEFELLIGSSNVETVERMKRLLAEHDEIHKREMDFKASCRNELQELGVILQQLKSVDRAEEKVKCLENIDDSDSVKNVSLEMVQRLTNAQLELADLNRQIATEQRILDNIPTQSEISQYQRRIVELYNQMASLHQETKQFYILHNTLVDIKNFMKKEVDMLNSIDDVQDLTSKQNYKDSFVENLQKILKGVGTSFDKVSAKKNELQARRNKLYEEHQDLLEKERLYYKTVDDFKNVCHENEELRRRIENDHLI